MPLQLRLLLNLLENIVDIMIYKQYNLTYDEIKIIDPEFKMSKKDFEDFGIEEK